MSPKIAFFGASVTQQKKGYAKYITDILNFENKIFGYGSMHINDAGICYIDDVIQYNPQYCFIDWFSTGYIEYNKDNFDEILIYVNNIIHKFLSKGIIVIFLFFPDFSINSITNEMVNKKDIYAKLSNYLDSINIPKIDLSEKFTEYQVKAILRDGIHTTEYGSEMYAINIIDTFLGIIYKNYKIPKIFPEKTKYNVIKKIDCRIIVEEYITLKGPCEIIGICQTIGPYSGLLQINNDVIINNWDKWCYYERDVIRHNFQVNDIITIKVLNDSLDYSSCHHTCNFNTNKLLNLKSIYYTGDELEIISYT